MEQLVSVAGTKIQSAVMKLVDIYTLAPVKTRQFLYDLLKERPPEANISHRQMPTFEDHCAFVSSRPYAAWYLIFDGGDPAGSIYLTQQGEIGIHLIKSRQKQGLGANAVSELMRQHGRRRYLANIAPANEPSRKMFKGMGFKLIQETYEKAPC